MVASPLVSTFGVLVSLATVAPAIIPSKGSEEGMLILQEEELSNREISTYRGD
jgi:hypothetical protein